MTSLSKHKTALAEAIIDAADISAERKSRYKTQWRRWDQWCSEHSVAPYHAPHEDMEGYKADHPKMSEATRKRLSAALNLVYKLAPGSGPVHLIGKPNHKPTSEISEGFLRAYQIWSSNFTNWCHARGKVAIPADQHDIAAYMQQLSTDYPPATTIGIFAHISRLHANAGYHDISKLPAVVDLLSDIRARIQKGEKQTPPRGKNPSTITQRERYRNNWRDWAMDKGVDINVPSTANICDFIREEFKYLPVKRIRPKLLAISEMYKFDPTKAREVTELLDALVQQDTEEQRQGIKKQKRNKVPLLSAPLPTNPNLVDQLRSEGLTQEEIQRVTSFQALTLSDRTRKSYQRYWGHYKIWCQKRTKQPEDAGPGLLSVYLIELSGDNNPRTLKNHLAAIRYCYKQVRPRDNPGFSSLVFSTMVGITKGNPSAPSSVTGLRHEHYEVIKATNHEPRPHERPYQTEIRVALDIALIGLMRNGLLRSGEASKVQWEHLQEHQDGEGRTVTTLFIPVSKNDPTGNGTYLWVSPETVEALDRMDHLRGQHGIVSKDDRIFQLSRNSIVEHIKLACESAGIPGRFGGHSPRIGMAEDLGIADTSHVKLSHAGRWENPTMAIHYTRRMETAKGAVARWHERDEETGRVEHSPLSSFGLISPYKGAPYGH